MTAKEYLSKARPLIEMIRQKEELLEETRIRAEGLAGLAADQVRVKSSADPDRMTEAVAKIISIEDDIAEGVVELMQTKAETLNVIQHLEDPIKMRLLYLRYVRCLSWTQVYDGIEVCDRQGRRLHAEALDDVDPYIPRQGVNRTKTE